MSGRIDVTAEFIEQALAVKERDFGNEVLYSLCTEYPEHSQSDALTAVCERCTID